MQVGIIIHPLGTGRNDNTRCRAMEKQVGKQLALLPRAMDPHLIIRNSSEKPKGQCPVWGKKKTNLKISKSFCAQKTHGSGTLQHDVMATVVLHQQLDSILEVFLN